MSAQNFTAVEKSDAQGRSFAILWRFIVELKHLRYVAIPYLALMTCATILPQLFVWLTGEYSKCESISNCTVVNPIGGGTLALTPGLLAIVVIAATVVRI